MIKLIDAKHGAPASPTSPHAKHHSKSAEELRLQKGELATFSPPSAEAGREGQRPAAGPACRRNGRALLPAARCDPREPGRSSLTATLNGRSQRKPVSAPLCLLQTSLS